MLLEKWYGDVTCAVMAFADAGRAGKVAAALAAGAPFAQAVGRLRCIVQGCCHGRPLASGAGFRVRNPFSRVVALAGLRDVAIHPTQMYSIAGNVLVALVVLRLWRIGASWPQIVGAYLLLSSLFRFVEEHYRGEPQTRRLGGLAVYQWLAASTAVGGVLLSCVPGSALAAARAFDAATVTATLLLGSVAAVLMSVDFPGSRARFSQLTVRPTEQG